MAITLRQNKSTALTHDQLDANFIDLNTRTTTIEGAYVTSVNGLIPTSGAVSIDSDDVTEGTVNRYYTDTRARASLSVTDVGGDGSLSYNNSTGVFTYTGPSASEVRAHLSAATSGDGSLTYNSTSGVFTYVGPSAIQHRAHFSVTDNGGDGSLTYNSTTGVFEYTGPSPSEVRAHFSAGDGITLNAGAISVGAGQIKESMIDFGSGAGEVDTDNVPEGATNIYYTDTRADARIAAASIDDLSDVNTPTPNANDVLTWNSIAGEWQPAVAPGASGGEANTISSLGTGVSIVSTKVGVDLQFRSIIGTAPIVATQNANDITLTWTPSSNIDANTQKIINVVDPTANQDVATKAYVDSQISSGVDVEIDLAADTGTSTVNTSQTLTFTGTANEIETSVTGQTVTFGLPNDVTITNDLSVGNDLAITGNLTVNGTTTTINVTDLAVDDSLIRLGVGNETSDLIDIGFVGHYYDGANPQHAGLFRDATDGKWKLFDAYGLEPTTNVIDISDADFAHGDLQLQKIEFMDSDASNSVAFQAPGTVASDIVWTLPAADAAVSGYALVSNGAGTLSWAAAGATITSDTSTNTDFLLYFASTTTGALTAAKQDSGLTYNPSTGKVTAAQFAGGFTGNLTGNVTGDVTGNADTATALATGRTISLTGDVTGTSAAFDGSGNVSIAATIAANSVALGTDTTGSYVAQGATAGVGLSGSVNSESATFTVTSNATSANTANTIVARDANGDFSARLVTANLVGNATNATSAVNATNAAYASNIVVAADNTTNSTHYIIFTGGASGNQAPNSDTGLTYNPSTNTLSTSIFSGTSTAARYADLAERYTADAEYPAGTVVTVGGEAEVTLAQSDSTYIAGVISTQPAYLMNKDLDGPAVALVGRVPVRVVGSVNKGQAVFATDNGLASTNGQGPIVGIALETNSDLGEKSVECMLKV